MPSIVYFVGARKALYPKKDMPIICRRKTCRYQRVFKENLPFRVGRDSCEARLCIEGFSRCMIESDEEAGSPCVYTLIRN